MTFTFHKIDNGYTDECYQVHDKDQFIGQVCKARWTKVVRGYTHNRWTWLAIDRTGRRVTRSGFDTRQEAAEALL